MRTAAVFRGDPESSGGRAVARGLRFVPTLLPMSAPESAPESHSAAPDRGADWEAFYRDYRKPGYVPGFEITSKLGGGMFGLVFRARKQSIGKDYAIKFLQVDDTEVRRAVLAELEQVKLFAQIDHPNLVSIEDRGEVDGIPYLVMSFAGTETLRDKLSTNGEPPAPEQRDELVRFFLQCCRGLSALHERSLVHFDIKPANVFLKGSVARLGDYGLSKLVTHSRGSLSMGRGTPYYMAPEMLQRRGDARSDVYSLGVMLYEILCGKVPFTGDSEWEVLRQHETKPPELPGHLSPLERAVLQRCLQKDPAARYQSVHDLIAALGGAATAPLPAAPRREPPPLPVRVDGAAPSCVPPMQARAPQVAAVKKVPARRSGVGLLVFAAMLGVAAFLFGAPARGVVEARASAASRPVEVRTTRSSRTDAKGLAAQIEQAINNAQQAVRTAVQKRKAPALAPLDATKVAEPFDFAAYRDRVETFASTAFSAGHGKRLEQWGRAAFLAGVALLQELDYECAEDCQRAANLHRLLGSMTAIDGLGADAVAGEPGPIEQCRFTAVAVGWRRLAEQFARDDSSFDKLLAARGKTGAGADR